MKISLNRKQDGDRHHDTSAANQSAILDLKLLILLLIFPNSNSNSIIYLGFMFTI